MAAGDQSGVRRTEWQAGQPGARRLSGVPQMSLRVKLRGPTESRRANQPVAEIVPSTQPANARASREQSDAWPRALERPGPSRRRRASSPSCSTRSSASAWRTPIQECPRTRRAIGTVWFSTSSAARRAWASRSSPELGSGRSFLGKPQPSSRSKAGEVPVCRGGEGQPCGAD